MREVRLLRSHTWLEFLAERGKIKDKEFNFYKTN